MLTERKSRYITYQLRETNASTQYTIIEEEERILIIQHLIRIMAFICESDVKKGDEWKEIRNKIFHGPLSPLPKRRGGQNTISSFTGGLINNLVFGSQRDFSDKQLKGITFITDQLSQINEDIPHLIFVEEE